METELGASGRLDGAGSAREVTGLTPGTGCSLGGKEQVLEKRLRAWFRGRGERAGCLLRGSADKDAYGDCQQHPESREPRGRNAKKLILKSMLVLFLIGFLASSRQLWE